LSTRKGRCLLKAWLTAAVRPRGPYPSLILAGVAGSAKSTTSRVRRTLIDPHVTPLRSLPHKEQDLMIAAANSAVLAFDNLGHLPDDTSDALCRVATASGFATRQLFTDADETYLDACRPVILDGIEDVASRGDLLQRALALDPPPIPDGRRRTEAEFWRAFEAAHPRLLGALLDVVAGALAALPGTRLAQRPWMADSAVWGEAGSRAEARPEGEFLDAYAENQARAAELALEASPAALAVVALMAAKPSWSGTATDLLSALEELVDSSRRRRAWPQSPRGLAGTLRRAAPGLRVHGIQVEFGRGNDRARTRTVTITRGAWADEAGS
jgi:hypothetical protein